MNIKPEDLSISRWESIPTTGWAEKQPIGIKIFHHPSGIAVTCEAYNTVHGNKSKAMEILKGKLAEMPMKTTAEKIKIMQAFEDGKVIQERAASLGAWEISEHPNWNWACIYYRVKPQTVEEASDKTRNLTEEDKKKIRKAVETAKPNESLIESYVCQCCYCRAKRGFGE